MTVTTTDSEAQFATNGVTTSFPFSFKFLDDADLIVVYIDSNGAETQLALNGDYTVTGAGSESGGTVNTTVALPAGALTIERDIEALQQTDLRNQGSFFSEVHEFVFDKLTLLVQQALGRLSRTIRVAIGDPEPKRLPRVTDRANKIFTFDENGDPVARAPDISDATGLAAYLAGSNGGGSVGIQDPNGWFGPNTVQNALDELGGSSIRGTNGRGYNALIGVIAANGGPLAFLNDSGHQPSGFSLSVSQPNTYSTQVDFLEVAGHVGTFVAVPDETYAQNGISAGCSVFTDRAVIQASAPLSLEYAGFNAITSTPLWNSGGLITNTLMPNGGVKIGHPQALSNAAPVVTPLQTTGMAGTELVISDYTDNDVTVCAVDDMNGFISYNGTSWNQTLSNNVVAPASIVFSAGNLTITHADVGTNNYNVSLGAFGTPYQVVVSNVSANTIVINFYNAAGTLVTVADTSMKFFYRRNAKVVRNLTGVAFSLNRGQCLIPNAAYQNLPSGNFWLYGVNQII